MPPPRLYIYLGSGQCCSCPQPRARGNTLLAAGLPRLASPSRNRSLALVRHAIRRRLYILSLHTTSYQTSNAGAFSTVLPRPSSSHSQGLYRLSRSMTCRLLLNSGPIVGPRIARWVQPDPPQQQLNLEREALGNMTIWSTLTAAAFPPFLLKVGNVLRQMTV